MKEKPKKSVRMWVAGDKSNRLFLFRNKPEKVLGAYVWIISGPSAFEINPDLFPSVKWEDKEPTRVVIRLA